MSRWQRRVDELLYDGETVRESLDIGPSRVVVTSHRVLVFKPDMDGENFRQADRPNITGVGTGARGVSSFLRRGIMVGVLGLVLLVAGIIFDPESLFGGNINLDTSGGQQLGLGGVMDGIRSMFALLVNLDTILRTFGVLALVLAAVILGVYWYLRTPTLVIEQAGEQDDVHIPRPENATETATQLERAILPDRYGNASVGETGSGGEGFTTDNNGFSSDTTGEEFGSDNDGITDERF